MKNILLLTLLAVAIVFTSSVLAGTGETLKQDKYQPKTSSIKKNNPEPTTNLINEIEIFLNKNSASITGVATVTIAIFTIVMWRVSRRQAQITREAMIFDRRAFVFAVGLNRYYEFDSGSQTYNWRFRPIFKNSGYTPTKDMTFLTECLLCDEPLVPGFSEIKKDLKIGKGMIPPQSTVDGSGAPDYPSPGITPQNLLDVHNGKKHLYLRGWIKYHDIFPNTPQHVTRFFWEIQCGPDPFTSIPEELAFAFTQFAEGNCADEGCS